jgi:hypothetical protein
MHSLAPTRLSFHAIRRQRRETCRGAPFNGSNFLQERTSVRFRVHEREMTLWWSHFLDSRENVCEREREKERKKGREKKGETRNKS